MARLDLVNLGTNSDLALEADVQNIVINGLDCEVSYQCAAKGCTLTRRHVAQAALDAFVGWTVPADGTEEVALGSLREAISWLTAGRQTPRHQFDDEVDYRAVTGEQARYRLSEMRRAGTFDPSEFPTCMLLRNHSAVDWGHYTLETTDERLGYWEDNVGEMLDPWPDLPRDQVGMALVTFVRLVDDLETQFQRVA